MTEKNGRQAHSWRSRGFVQPLLLTIGGVTASWVFADAISGSCGGGEVCAYLAMASVASFLVAMVPGLIGTGFVVGLSSDDGGLTSRAILVAGAILCLTASMFSTVTSSNLESFSGGVVYLLETALIVGILLLVAAIPFGLGFGFARLIRGWPRGH